MKWTRICLFAFWVTLSVPVSAQDFTAKCVGVTDGDTITVLVGLDELKIRLEGIDAPERGQDFASRARQFTSDLVFGEQVQILPKEKNRYGATRGKGPGR